MLDDFTATCDAAGCDRTFENEDCVVVYRTTNRKRLAFRCECGAVTVTVEE